MGNRKVNFSVDMYEAFGELLENDYLYGRFIMLIDLCCNNKLKKVNAFCSY